MVEVDAVVRSSHGDEGGVERARAGHGRAFRSADVQHGVPGPHRQGSVARLDHPAVGDGDRSLVISACGKDQRACRFESGAGARDVHVQQACAAQ
ncbi:hypothetical protein D3C80_913330 [compost metagenome]